MVNGLVFTHLAVPHRTEGGVEFIELDLIEMQIVQNISGKGMEVLSCLYQPAQDGVGIDLKDTCRASNAQALGQTGDDMHNEFGRGPLAVENRSLGFIKISLTRRTLKLAPGLATGMTVGADVTAPEPAVIRAIRSWTEMPRSIDGAPAATGEDDRRRW